MMSPARRRFGIALLVASAAFRVSGLSFSFTNSDLILITDTTAPPTRASPYPSNLSVTGLTGQVITKATVTLNALSHGYPSDVTVLLVGPSGQKTVIMSETGGQIPLAVTNLTITLDDDAASSLPIYSRLSSGTFKPTNGYFALGHTSLPYDLPAPAPAPNSNCAASLALFKNTDPAGVWTLFVVDDASGNDGAISNGWILNLEIAVPLTATRQGTNVVISWPGSARSAVLQSANGFASTWNDVATTPVLVSNRWTVTNAIAAGIRWFRLRTN
jgi:subtilisin-like proprotein convertase family protein